MSVPSYIIQEVCNERSKLQAGADEVFCGPDVELPPGECMSDTEVLEGLPLLPWITTELGVVRRRENGGVEGERVWWGRGEHTLHSFF